MGQPWNQEEEERPGNPHDDEGWDPTATEDSDGTSDDRNDRPDAGSDEEEEEEDEDASVEPLPEETVRNHTNAEQDSPRRSHRKRTSTVIHVRGGYTIQKDNNYVLKGGTYSFGVADSEIVEAPPTARKKPRQQQRLPASNVTHHPCPKEARRRQGKRDLEKAIQIKKPLRDAFLKQHLAALQPFIEPNIASQIQNVSLTRQSCTKELQVAMQPDAIQGELRDYQLQGLQFMARMHSCNMGMILGDEMGLGKTIQTISLVCYIKEQYETNGPSLIICPMSVLYSWCNEIQKWAPSLRHLRFHSSSTDDAAIQEEDLNSYDIIVTTYEMAKSQNLLRVWQRQAFHLLVLDEGHRIKSLDTQISHAVRKIHAENRIILTGTPLANDLVELYSLLNFLAPDVFTTEQPFAQAFDLSTHQVDANKLNQAHTLLSVFMLRRLKEKVEKLLPKNLETKVICPLSTTQIWWYKAILLKDISLLTNGGQGKGAQLSNLIMQLRKCCLHPFLFDGAEDIESTTLEMLVGASGKLTVLDKLLCSLYRKKHRVCLFSQFTQVLDILEDYCALRGWRFVRFDGSTARAKRNYVVNAFNAPNSEIFIFLMSTRAGGMGLNLQTADTCILFDSDWNPQPDKQAMARVCRIGQTKKVHTYRLVTEGTVEQRMIERAEKKLYLDRMVTRDGTDVAFQCADESLNVNMLMDTLKFGCASVFGKGSHQSNRIPTDEEIELITDRDRTENCTMGDLKGAEFSSAASFDATRKFSSTTDFAGIDFAAIREQYRKQKRPNSMVDIGVVWRKKREAKHRIQMMEAKGSGYGSVMVPVLKANDYDLETGERSVFQRELRGRHEQSRTKLVNAFEHQDFCQVCHDGGDLIMCPRCPCCVHLECSGLSCSKQFLCCSHHRCTICGKSASAAGGFLFPCSACPYAYCEDHLPQDATFIERCRRMESLGFAINLGVYVHCSSQCEKVAREEFGYKPDAKKSPSDYCPQVLDVSSYFGNEVDDSLEAPEDLILHHKRQRKPVISETESAGTRGLKSVFAESPDRNDDVDEDFLISESHIRPPRQHQAKWHDAVAPAVTVQLLIDGAPVPTVGLQPKRIRSCAASDLLPGEYDLNFPVVDKKIGMRIASNKGYPVFISMKKIPGSQQHRINPRNVGDIIVNVNGVNTRHKSIEHVKGLIQQGIRNDSSVTLRFFDVTTLRYGFYPYVGSIRIQPSVHGSFQPTIKYNSDGKAPPSAITNPSDPSVHNSFQEPFSDVNSQLVCDSRSECVGTAANVIDADSPAPACSVN